MRVTSTTPSQVADGQVLGPVVVLPVAGVTGLGLEGGGGGGLGQGDAGHRNGGRRGRPILLAHPGSSKGGGRRGRIWELGNDCLFILRVNIIQNRYKSAEMFILRNVE